MNENKVTVLMPVYNAGEYLKEAIESILKQTFTNLTLLIIDDCSTDGSANVAKSFDDQRIKLLVNQKNLGLSASLNIGIENASTKYIARMDQDDISLPNRIEEQLNFMEANRDIGVCGTYIEAFSPSGSRLKKFPIKDADIKVMLLFNSPLAHPTVMIRKEILDKYELKYDSNYDGAEDYDLWERMSKFTRMENIPKVLFRYRLHQSQLSRISPTKQAKVDKIQKRQYDRLNIEKDDLSGLLNANKKHRLYNDLSLRKIVYKLYYQNFKSIIKKLLRWDL